MSRFSMKLAKFQKSEMHFFIILGKFNVINTLVNEYYQVSHNDLA